MILTTNFFFWGGGGGGGAGGGGVGLIRLYFFPTTPVVRCIKLFTITLGGGGGGGGRWGQFFHYPLS